MADWFLDVNDNDIDAALANSAEFEQHPRVLRAEYSRHADVVVLHLNNGRRLAIPREELQGLQHATEPQLSEIAIYGGLNLAWPQLDVDHYLPDLLEGSYGTKAWMKSLEHRNIAA